jgi:hypothetical protein
MNATAPASTIAEAMLPSIDMLEALRRGLGRAKFTLGVTAIALFTGGCASGEHDATFHFLVLPLTGSVAFKGWTDITVGVDVSSVGTAVLYGVTLQVESPTTVADLSFLSTLTGAATDPNAAGAFTTLVTLDSFPPGETSADMQIDYPGDLRPLFDSTNTIRINWTGNTNPAFTAWPAGGIWVAGDVSIDVE